MFCKVCYDAYQPDYQTHTLKDKSGNIICPFLLNTACLTCGSFGHTSKYCKPHSMDLINSARPISNNFDNEFPLHLVIIWGVGFAQFIGKNWADL